MRALNCFVPVALAGTLMFGAFSAQASTYEVVPNVGVIGVNNDVSDENNVRLIARQMAASDSNPAVEPVAVPVPAAILMFAPALVVLGGLARLKYWLGSSVSEKKRFSA